MPAPQTIIDSVTAKVSPNTYPKLTPQEISDIIDETAYWVAWAPSTHYDPGALVMPSSRTGVIWKATIAGTSGTREPDWLLIWDVDYPFLFQDGTVYWQAGVVDSQPGLYNVRQAIYQCWLTKAGKASGDFSFNAGDAGSANPSAVADNCRTQAKLYRPFFVK